jgi:hypothetical protein
MSRYPDVESVGNSAGGIWSQFLGAKVKILTNMRRFMRIVGWHAAFGLNFPVHFTS